MAQLAAHGFHPTLPAIDVADSGIDRGVITPDKLHLTFSTQPDRFGFVCVIIPPSLIRGCSGHGTINASIAAGAHICR
jgi:hypothetical protein